MQNLLKNLISQKIFTKKNNLFPNKYQPKKYFSNFNNSNNSQYFSPNKRLLFKNNRLRIFTYQQYGGVKKGYIILTAFFGYLTINSLYKLYHYKDRNFFGFLIYGGTALFFLPRIGGLPRTFNKIISHIDLLQDGKHVLVGHAKYGFLAQEIKVDIGQIAKPQSPEIAAFVQFGFPILLEGELYYLPRDNENMDGEVLPAVMNGHYIDTNEIDEEIVI